MANLEGTVARADGFIAASDTYLQSVQALRDLCLPAPSPLQPLQQSSAAAARQQLLADMTAGVLALQESAAAYQEAGASFIQQLATLVAQVQMPPQQPKNDLLQRVQGYQVSVTARLAGNQQLTAEMLNSMQTRMQDLQQQQNLHQ